MAEFFGVLAISFPPVTISPVRFRHLPLCPVLRFSGDRGDVGLGHREVMPLGELFRSAESNSL